MKKIFLIILTLAFFAGCGKPFEETYKQSLEELKSKKSQAITFEDFYNKYVKDKSDLQIKAQKEEWSKNKSWPIISFNYEILSVKDIESSVSNKSVNKNKDKFANVCLSVPGDNYNQKFIFVYMLKKDAVSLIKSKKLKGYGQSYSLSSTLFTVSFNLYPAIIE